ncbi:MarR family winged helix-turn-helix transcriptional regulator [Nocardioides sp.]|uniref:MarR family winged helix-turn-helix transcriptional regulator n=1 Tax=Nocardioides sp. TaxID=35761 RepID=UPI0035199086
MTTPADGAPELDRLVCFDLYAASRAVTAAYRPILGRLGLTYPQYLVVMVAGARGEVTIKGLADALHLDHATLTPLLRRLEQHGLLTRSRSAQDERVVLVRLTEKGEAVRAEFGDVQCRIEDAFGPMLEQAAQLQTLLRDLVGQLVPSRAG